ncbi:MAG: hypothetical protein HC821_00220 [Lewinella sp.]|nr:hypothetical protein [Lewinella sp.]
MAFFGLTQVKASGKKNGIPSALTAVRTVHSYTFSRILLSGSTLVASLLLLLLTALSSCVFEDFDEPPVRGLTTLRGNISIAELKALHTLGSDATAIPDGRLLEAVVGGNDISGNIFKELYVQDSTGGLVLRIDVAGLNGLFPVGTPVVIRLDGLFIGDFNNKYQLTVRAGDRIPEALLPSTIFVNGDVLPVTPTLVTLAELNDPTTFNRLLSTLIAIDNVQFIDSDSGAPFADVPAQRDLNRSLRDCFGNEIVTRTSVFSDFAGDRTPTGNGRIVALLDVFGTTQQLKFRELADFMLTGERCGISVGGELISIAELRSRFTGAATNIAGERQKFGGIVIF